MSSSLVSVLHQEERAIVAELRASKPFQRLEGIRRLLALYDAQPSVATGLDMPPTGEPDRGPAEVITFAAPPPATPVYTPPPPQLAPAPAAPVTAQAAAPAPAVAPPAAKSIAMPGPAAKTAAPAAQVAAMAQAAVADVAMRAPAPMPMETESASVVSSVRAALLGIGKN